MNLRAVTLRFGLLAGGILSFGVGYAASPAETRSTGHILGNVRNSRGIAQMGARVFLYNRFDQVISRGLTDEIGRFIFDGLAPDIYTVRVLLASFVPAERKNISVLPSFENRLDISLTSILSTVQMVSTPMAPGTLMSDDWKWVLRASQSTRPVLRFLPGASDTLASGISTSSHSDSPFSQTSGVLRLSAGDGQSLARGTEQGLGTAFALATSLAGSARLQLSGNLGYTGTALSATPGAAFRTTYIAGTAGISKPEVVVTMRQLNMAPRAGSGITVGSANAPPLRTMSAALIDKTQIAENITLDYGFDFQSISFMDRLNYLSPFIRASMDFGGQGRVRAAYTSGGQPTELLLRDAHRQGDLDLNFAALAQMPGMSLTNSHVPIERTQNLELGYERVEGSRTYSLAAYREIVSNGAFMVYSPDGLIPASDLLPDLTSRSSIFNAGSYQRLGYTAAIKQALGDKTEISIAAGRTGAFAGPSGARASFADASELRSEIRQVQRAWVTVKMAGTIPGVGTRVSANYGWTDFGVMVPVHIFVTQNAYQDIGVNIYIRQPLPVFAGLPWRVEATADLRNMMAQGYLPMGGRSVLTNSPRAMRAGLNFIF